MTKQPLISSCATKDSSETCFSEHMTIEKVHLISLIWGSFKENMRAKVGKKPAIFNCIIIYPPGILLRKQVNNDVKD